MADYYEILGLKTGADELEIKIAFRSLAKLYHPDKNPNGREHFTKILKAYEVLSDPHQKSVYDQKLRYQFAPAQNQDAKPGTKTWRFDEKELKRRQYYNEYIKKQTEDTGNFEAPSEKKKPYSDYKYIFFATPLAVALFLLIMNMATSKRVTRPRIVRFTSKAISDRRPATQLSTGTVVYTDFFGLQKPGSKVNHKLSVKNNSADDIILCLFFQKDFLKSVFIKHGDVHEIPGLPNGFLRMRYSSGANFDTWKKLGIAGATGAFRDRLHFYKSRKPDKVKLHDVLILQNNDGNFEEITAKEFFSKE